MKAGVSLRRFSCTLKADFCTRSKCRHFLLILGLKYKNIYAEVNAHSQLSTYTTFGVIKNVYLKTHHLAIFGLTDKFRKEG